jgi:hypothetical protein
MEKSSDDLATDKIVGKGHSTSSLADTSAAELKKMKSVLSDSARFGPGALNMDKILGQESLRNSITTLLADPKLGDKVDGNQETELRLILKALPPPIPLPPPPP